MPKFAPKLFTLLCAVSALAVGLWVWPRDLRPFGLPTLNTRLPAPLPHASNGRSVPGPALRGDRFVPSDTSSTTTPNEASRGRGADSIQSSITTADIKNNTKNKLGWFVTPNRHQQQQQQNRNIVSKAKQQQQQQNTSVASKDKLDQNQGSVVVAPEAGVLPEPKTAENATTTTNNSRSKNSSSSLINSNSNNNNNNGKNEGSTQNSQSLGNNNGNKTKSDLLPTLVVQTEITGYDGHVLSDLPPTEGSRFLIFECVASGGLCGGWADRQEGLVTVFLLARLSGRRFGIRMNTPCDLTRFLLPNHYDWTVKDAEIQGRSSRHVFGIDKSDFSRGMPDMDFNARYPEDVVILQTNRDLLADITANPHYRDVLPAWARQPRPQFFRDVWRTLMKPAPRLQQRLQSFLLSIHYFNRTRPLVGVHVRTGGSRHFTDGNLGDKLSRIGQLWDFVQPYVGNGSDVFVASDNPEVRQSSAAKFGPRHRDTQAVLRHIDRQRSDPVICQAFEDAVVDQLILTRCDVLVVSPGSGYSSRAAMMRGTNRGLYDFGQDGVFPADMYKMCDPIC
ncbi:uncharacterized protein LOC143288061 [Babylonia areolata]|uniref:uncharacterized protein LOC143288061 n=1 Tax=Babylonia areolata TaxID=304850 RepID=UPI003FCF1A85